MDIGTLREIFSKISSKDKALAIRFCISRLITSLLLEEDPAKESIFNF
jgi:hypothetical protein